MEHLANLHLIYELKMFESHGSKFMKPIKKEDEQKTWIPGQYIDFRGYYITRKISPRTILFAEIFPLVNPLLNIQYLGRFFAKDYLDDKINEYDPYLKLELQQVDSITLPKPLNIILN